MAYEESLKSISLDADSSIGIYTGPPGLPGSLSPNSAKQFHVVKVSGSGTAGLCTLASNEIPCGVLQNKPQNVGDAATVAISGVSMCELGGTVAAGAGVKVDATGRFVTWVGGTDAVTLLKGVAIYAGAIGQLAPVLLQING
jgi:hypothetical protein